MLKFDMSGLESGLNSFIGKSDAALRGYAENAALKLQNHMRDKAPWVDRTGHARQRLTTEVRRVAQGYLIELSHGVDYGVWLELAHEKNYAILEPTIRLKSGEVLKGLERLLERL